MRCRRIGGLCQAKVQDLYRAIREIGRIRAARLELDVRGLEIAVDDALFVRGLEGRGDLRCQRQCLTNRDGSSSYPLSEIVALDELHDERASACGGFPARGQSRCSDD